MKALSPCIVATLVVLLTACGDGKSDAAKQMAAATDSIKAASTVDLGKYQLPLTVELPPGIPAHSIVWKEEAGKLEVRAGDHFGISIMEDPGDMARLKGDLDRDLLKKNTIIRETPDELVYRSEFPDDSTLVFFHFHRIVQAGGRTFTVEDVNDGPAFSEAEVEFMAKSVRPKEAT